MSLINTILDIMKSKNKKQSALCAHLGLNASTVTNWKLRNTDPPAKYIIPICEFLEVTPYYLLTGAEKEHPLPKDEQELLDCYKRLPEREKQRLIGRASALAEVYGGDGVSSSPEARPRTIKIRHSYYKVSAGTGYDLDGIDKWDTIDIADTPEAREADFCLTISGNSMEPVYYDGDIVLVKSQPDIDNGEIGIFIVENAGYIKKFGGDRLISLNAEYEDILFSHYDPEEIRCVGLVIGRV
ncbi:MAG: helix-turn-helix domain-containing protein [Oscillospiraceae bacterium]|nr:helix-turn-helix domain-containing protein [Oscillospiraceae bacterium]